MRFSLLRYDQVWKDIPRTIPRAVLEACPRELGEGHVQLE